MKRIAYIALGALAGAALVFFTGSVVTNWYATAWAKSQDEVDVAIDVFLWIWPFVILFGGYIGNALHRRNLTQPSS